MALPVPSAESGFPPGWTQHGFHQPGRREKLPPSPAHHRAAATEGFSYLPKIHTRHTAASSRVGDIEGDNTQQRVPCCMGAPSPARRHGWTTCRTLCLDTKDKLLDCLLPILRMKMALQTAAKWLSGGESTAPHSGPGTDPFLAQGKKRCIGRVQGLEKGL